MTVVVGVDLGSSAARAIACDQEGQILATSAVGYRGSDSWPAGRADPNSWLEAMLTAMNELGLRYPEAHKPAALAVGGQTPTTVPMSGGLAVTVGHRAVADLGLHEVHAAQCEILRAELGDGFEPCEIWDWVLRQLGGGPFCGLWPGDPLPAGFGEPIATGSSVGVSNGSHGLAKGTVLVPAAADAFMGFWACGAYSPGFGHDPGGRTGGLGLAVASDSVRGDMFSMPSALQGVSIVGGPVNGHGRLVEWWASVSGLSISSVLAKAAQVPPGAGGTHVLPYLAGERDPRWDKRLTGEIHGLSLDSGPAEISRAVLESTAYGLAHIAENLAAGGYALQTLVCGGSPALSRLWCEIKASVLGVEVLVPEKPDYSAAYGSALAAGAGLDWWPKPGVESAAWPMPAMQTILPTHDSAYEHGYRRFIELGDSAVARLDAARLDGV